MRGAQKKGRSPDKGPRPEVLAWFARSVMREGPERPAVLSERSKVRSRIAVLLAALGLLFGAVSCGGGGEDQEEQEDQQEEQQQGGEEQEEQEGDDD